MGTQVPIHRTLAALQGVTTAHPTARKWLVGPDLGWSRALLFTLARHTGGWMGWESVTLKRIAADLAFVAMAERGIAPASDSELNAMVDEALEVAVRSGRLSPPFARLARGLASATPCAMPFWHVGQMASDCG